MKNQGIMHPLFRRWIVIYRDRRQSRKRILAWYFEHVQWRRYGNLTPHVRISADTGEDWDIPF